MYEIAHYKDITIDDVKRQLLNEASTILEQLERLYQVQKVLLNVITKYIIEDDMNSYKLYMERYHVISSMIDNLQRQKKNSLSDLKPIAELQKSNQEQSTQLLPTLNIIG